MSKGRIAPDKRGIISFDVSSGYGANTRKPFVQVEVGGMETQMSPEEARALGLNLLEAAEAAQSDEAIVLFCLDVLHLDMQTAVASLAAYRKIRARRHGDSPSAA